MPRTASPSPDDVLCGSATAAVKALKELGAPAVVKIASADIGHKSDLGLVRLGVASPADMRRCWDDFMAIVGRKAERATVDGVLVCETAPSGVETMVGVTRDDLFGPAVAFGLGGTLVEVFDDVSVRVAPFDKAEARRMIDETRVARVLAGSRGAKPTKVAAVVDVLMKSSGSRSTSPARSRRSTSTHWWSRRRAPSRSTALVVAG